MTKQKVREAGVELGTAQQLNPSLSFVLLVKNQIIANSDKLPFFK